MRTKPNITEGIFPMPVLMIDTVVLNLTESHYKMYIVVRQPIYFNRYFSNASSDITNTYIW